MEEDVVQAILIASNPLQGSLHQQALEYLSNIQQHANDTWRLALALYVDVTPDGNRKYPPQARFFALRVLDEFFDSRYVQECVARVGCLLIDSHLIFLQLRSPGRRDFSDTAAVLHVLYTDGICLWVSRDRGALYVSYHSVKHEVDLLRVSVLRNKFSHTLTLFFLCTYIDQWSTFFIDLFTLIHPAKSPDQPAFNRHVSLLFFHVVLEISEEVADQVIKSARPFNQVRHTRDARVRDAVRERDAPRINDAVLTIVADGSEKLSTLRKAEHSWDWGRELDGVVEVVDCGIRTFGSYVSTSIRGSFIVGSLNFYFLSISPLRLDRHQLDCHADHDSFTIFIAF
jgi:exportin-T